MKTILNAAAKAVDFPVTPEIVTSLAGVIVIYILSKIPAQARGLK
jgi:hypothetical protein